MKNILLLFACLAFTSLTAGEKTIMTSDGVALYVKVEGKGTPLLYVHGGPGSGSLWFEKFFGDFMEQHFTVVYLDQRGVGRSSSAVDGNYALDRMALDFEEVRKNLGYDNWLTLGHSFGGILQMGYANRFPDAHKGMLMINCTVDINRSSCESWLPKAAEFVGEEYSCVGDSVALLQRMNEFGGKLREKGMFWKMGSGDPGTFQKLDEATAVIKNFNYHQSQHVLNRPEYWSDFSTSTAHVKVPVLYFYGTTDYMVGPEHYKALKFPKLLLWKNKGGHVPFIEDKEDLQKAIAAYNLKYGF